MRVNAGFMVAIALTLGGCLGSGAVPAVTGSVRPPVDAGDPNSQPQPPRRTLADAITLCLDRGTQVQTTAFRSCVTKARQSTPRDLETLARRGAFVR